MKHTYHIEGMTCIGCSAKVEDLLKRTPGVIDAQVDLEHHKAEISMDVHIGTNELNKALEGTKYLITLEENNIPSGLQINEDKEQISLKTYLPIFLIFGYITIGTLLIQLQHDHFNTEEWMAHFMAGFFLVFSFFKLLDVPAFAMSYSSYDIVAERFNSYGYIYPFIELGLGLSFIISSLNWWSNLITLVVMTVSVIGVIKNLLRKNPFQCACLGVVFKLPLSKVTLFEDLLMIVMSAIALIFN